MAAQLEVKKTLIKGAPTPIKTTKKTGEKVESLYVNIVGYVVGKVGSKEGKILTVEEAAGVAATYGLANAVPRIKNTKNGTTYFIVASQKGDSLKKESMCEDILDANGNIRKEFQDKFGALVSEKSPKGKSTKQFEETRNKIKEALGAKIEGIKF